MGDWCIMTSKLKATGDCSSHHLQGRGHIVSASLQAAQLIFKTISKIIEFTSFAPFVFAFLFTLHKLQNKRHANLKGFYSTAHYLQLAI